MKKNTDGISTTKEKSLTLTEMLYMGEKDLFEAGRSSTEAQCKPSIVSCRSFVTFEEIVIKGPEQFSFIRYLPLPPFPPNQSERLLEQ